MTLASKIKLPFGLNEKNVIVHINDVERGEKCNCICSECKSPLIAVKGRKKEHHFRHKNLVECERGLESIIHLAAKQMILEKKQITLPKYVYSESARDSKGHNHTEYQTYPTDTVTIELDYVEEEKTLHEMKADILGKKGDKSIIIEIYFRHKVDERKIEKIKKANISAIEINLSELKPDDVKNPEAFWAYINNPQHVKWLHNAKAKRIFQPSISEKLSLRIQEFEEGYIKFEEKIKIQFSQAIKTLEKYRNGKYKPNYAKTIKSNSIWRHFGQELPYSLEELPNFLNLYVLDGDWIFGCDRRIWQAIIYHSFICNENRERLFSIWQVASHIEHYTKIPNCIEIIDKLCRWHPELTSLYLLDNNPPHLITLKTYFNHLCDLGMLIPHEDNKSQVRDLQFRIISTTPIKTTLEG